MHEQEYHCSLSKQHPRSFVKIIKIKDYTSLSRIIFYCIYTHRYLILIFFSHPPVDYLPPPPPQLKAHNAISFS